MFGTLIKVYLLLSNDASTVIKVYKENNQSILKIRTILWVQNNREFVNLQELTISRKPQFRFNWRLKGWMQMSS